MYRDFSACVAGRGGAGWCVTPSAGRVVAAGVSPTTMNQAEALASLAAAVAACVEAGLGVEVRVVAGIAAPEERQDGGGALSAAERARRYRSNRKARVTDSVTDRHETSRRHVTVVTGDYGGSSSGSGIVKSAEEAGKDPKESEKSGIPAEQKSLSEIARAGAIGELFVTETVTKTVTGDVTRNQRSEPRADIAEVFDFWRSETGRTRSRLDPKRARRIAARIGEGSTVDELKAAIRNRRNDPFLMGQNDTGRVYDGIETLLRDAAQVERLCALAAPGRVLATARRPFNNGSTVTQGELMERARRIAEEEDRKAKTLEVAAE